VTTKKPVEEARTKLLSLKAISVLVKVAKNTTNPIIKENCFGVLTWFTQDG
jgi:hypothetical protein